MKKRVSLLLALLLILSLAVPARAEEPWYAQAQEFVTRRGWMTGTDKGFEPLGTVTRATVFQTVYNIQGRPTAGEQVFPDAEGTWYADAAAWAAHAGLANGDGSGLFCGDRAATRAEVAAILSRFMSFRGVEVRSTGHMGMFRDVSEVPEWAFSAFDNCVYYGLFSGDQDSKLCPNATATRAELATLLMRMTDVIK